MFNAVRSFQRINLHPTYGIVLFSIWHSAIVGLFAHFDLFLSALEGGLTTNDCPTQREIRSAHGTALDLLCCLDLSEQNCTVFLKPKEDTFSRIAHEAEGFTLWAGIPVR
jgi:hypothetical protein